MIRSWLQSANLDFQPPPRGLRKIPEDLQNTGTVQARKQVSRVDQVAGDGSMTGELAGLDVQQAGQQAHRRAGIAEIEGAGWRLQAIQSVTVDDDVGSIWLFDLHTQRCHRGQGREAVIARQKRDFVWIMARTPSIPEADYERLVAFVESIGYDVSELQRVPQRW